MTSISLPSDKAEAMVEALKDVTAHLVAACSLLSRSPKTAAPSNKMFDQMLKDYGASAERGRIAIAALSVPAPGTGGAEKRECPGADDPEERCPKQPHECTCWEVELDYHPKHVRAALSTPSQAGDMGAVKVKAWDVGVDDLVRDVAEWTDRTSPADYPGHLLITPDELKQFARDVAELSSTPVGEMVLVPREPTPHMMAKAFDAVELSNVPGFATGNQARRAIWDAMLAASPQGVR